MQRDSFVNECRRLYSGCSRDADLTPERLHVLWQFYGNLDVEVWSCAVDLGLLENRVPNAQGFERFVSRAEDMVQKRRASRANAEAASWPKKLERAAVRSDSEVAIAAIAKIRVMLNGADEWLPLEPWWERVNQTPPVHDWRGLLNRNRYQRGLPFGPPWTCGHTEADRYWADGQDSIFP